VTIRVRNFSAMALGVTQKAAAASAAARYGLLEVAGEVQELAQAYVPVDEYNLQAAIKVREVSNGFQVYVDENHTPGTRTKGESVRQYAFLMHEGIGYSGVALAGWPRGAKFMDRAGAEIGAQMQTRFVPRIAAQVRSTLVGSKLLTKVGGFFGRLGARLFSR
jgi:hypothetical protein